METKFRRISYIMTIIAWRADEENAKERRIGGGSKLGCLTNVVTGSISFNPHHHYRCHDPDAKILVMQMYKRMSNNIMQSELQVGLWVFHSLFSGNFWNTRALTCIPCTK